MPTDLAASVAIIRHGQILLTKRDDFEVWVLPGGEVDPGEGIYPNQYATWTPRLLRAAYNYQYAQKDPGAFAHNAKYVLQALYDSLEDMGADVSGMTRP